MKPSYIEWSNIGMCGIVGKAGSGKSSTMQLLLSQLALSGVGIVLVDGHGKFGSQTLASTCEPLAAAYVLPAAISDDDILESITSVYKLAKWRIENWNQSSDPPPIALVVDELTNILSRFDNADSDFIISALEFFATQARKANIKTFVASQNWTADFIGAASIRRSMNVTILHRVAPDVVSSFTNVLTVKRDVPNLQVGQAWVLNQTDIPRKVYLPKVTQDSLVAVQKHIPRYNPTKDVLIALGRYESSLRGDGSMEESVFDASGSYIQVSGMSKNTQNMIYTKIAEMRKIALEWGETHSEPITKAALIKKTFGIAPGRSKTYSAASKIYDYARSHGLL